MGKFATERRPAEWGPPNGLETTPLGFFLFWMRLVCGNNPVPNPVKVLRQGERGEQSLAERVEEKRPSKELHQELDEGMAGQGVTMIAKRWSELFSRKS